MAPAFCRPRNPARFLPGDERRRSRRQHRPALLATAALLAIGGTPALAAGPLPSGGQVVAGSATLQQSGSTLTIQQTSQRLIADWRSFDIAPGSTVRFVQPTASAVALNRVLGAGPSQIDGSLLANGQVFLLNPNGVIFGAGARVDTGGLVASTLALRDDDFMAGRYRLQGDSTAAVSNAGQLQAHGGGAVALIAAQVVNNGQITADRGGVVLASASDVTLDLGQTVRLQVHKGALDSLVDNGGAIRADGGTVLLTARAADELSRSVINQSGLVRARTLSTGEQGEIVLMGDMAHGTLRAGGELDASAPDGGRGGFIETSAAQVDLQAGLKVDAGSRSGAGGQWLIDPYDYTINATAASNIAAALNSGTSVTVTTQSNVAGYGSAGSSGGNGDITVASPITKTGGGAASLTLQADRNITVNTGSAITSTSGTLDITLSAANNAAGTLGGVALNANLASNGGRILIGGAGGGVTTTQSYGIGYALNTSSSTPAVRIGTNVSVSSAGGDITINGQSSASATGTYSGTRGGVYVLSGATVDTGGGNLYISGVSTADDSVFGFALEASSGTTTTFRTGSSGGGIFVDARNDIDALGSLGLTSNGSQARIQFWAPSVAHYLFRLNGSNQAATFTQSPPCNVGYPNCGTMVIPGGNQSYTSAGYNAVSTAMQPIYVFTGNGSRTYDGTTTASGVGLSALGGPSGFVVGDLGALAFDTPSRNAGSYTSLRGAAGNPTSYQSGTYAVAYFSQGIYTVSPRAITGFQAGNKVYDGTTAAAVSSSDIVPGDSVTVTATGGFASAGVGNGIAVNVTGVSISGADAANYTLPGGGSNISTTANITPAPLTVTAADASKTYDGLGYSGGNGLAYSGFVNGETSAVLGGTLAYSGSAQGAVNAGSYAITPQGLSAANYQISYASGTLTVNPATLTYTAGAASRTYGATNPAFSGTVGGFVNGETLAGATTGTLAFDSAANGSSGVGSYLVSGSGLSANHGNYVFQQAADNSTALSITPAPLTVTATNASKTYDGLAFNGGNGVSYSGFVNGETAAVLGGTLGYAGTAQGATNAGTYTLLPQGLTSSNYSLSFAAGSLTVNPATLSYAASNASRSYGSANPALGGSVTGFVNGETLASATTGTLAFTSAADGNSGVGAYPVTGSGLAANHGNYVFQQAAGNSTALSITPAALTVTATGASRTYDGQAFSGGNGITISGFVNGETAAVLGGTLGYAGNAQGATNAGTYAITPRGLTAANYSLSFASGSLTINPAVLTYAADAVSRSYGSANPALTGTVTGFVNGETLASATTGTPVFTSAANTGSHVGSYLVSGSGLTATNYVFQQGAGNAAALTVTPAPLTVTANGAGKTYDGLAFSGGNGVSISGFVNGDTAAVLNGTLAYGGSAQGATNAGSYAITPQGLSAADYNVSFASGTLTVSPAVLSYSASSASRSYGAANPALGGSVTGFVNGETLASATTGTLSFGTAAGAGSGVGSYAVTGSGLTANHGNYVFQQAAGNASALVVTPAPLTVTAASTSKTYDGLAFNGGNGVTYSGFVNGESAAVLGGTLDYAGSAQGATNAGSYTITPQGLTAANYSLSFTGGALTVNPAVLSYSAGSASRSYGAANPAFGGNVTGFVNGETLANATSGTLAFTTSAGSGSGVGTYAVTGSGLTANHGNYVFQQAAGNSSALSITPAPLTVTANAASKTYDGLAFSGGNGVTYSGFVNGETAAVLGGTLGYGGNAQGATNAGSYAITPQGLTATNYSLTFASGSLTVNPAVLSYSAASASRSYGAANPVLTGSVTGFVNGETLASATTGALSFGSTAGTGSGVGSYAINGSGLSANHGNYVFQQAAGNSTALSITPAPLTVTAGNAAKTYDGLAFNGGAGVNFAGFVNGEDASALGGTLGYGGAAQGAVNAGSYAILPQGLLSSNYAISYQPGTLTVNPATLTYTAGSASRSYGSANPVLTGTVSGFVNGETAASATSGTLLFTSLADGTSAVGGYAIVGSGLTALHGNYQFVQAPGNGLALTITAAPQSADGLLPRAVAVPNFPDNAGPALGAGNQTLPALGGLNYVPLASTAVVSNAPAAGGTAASPVAVGESTTLASTAPTGTSTSAPTGASPGAPANAPAPTRAARAGTAGIPVSSANGPLDVFVIDGGINLTGTARR